MLRLAKCESKRHGRLPSALTVPWSVCLGVRPIIAARCVHAVAAQEKGLVANAFLYLFRVSRRPPSLALSIEFIHYTPSCSLSCVRRSARAAHQTPGMYLVVIVVTSSSSSSSLFLVDFLCLGTRSSKARAASTTRTVKRWTRTRPPRPPPAPSHAEKRPCAGNPTTSSSFTGWVSRHGEAFVLSP